MKTAAKKRKSMACVNCGKSPLTKDEIGATKKLLGDCGAKCFCNDCLCELTGYDLEELEDLIAQFKQAGCQYFE